MADKLLTEWWMSKGLVLIIAPDLYSFDCSSISYLPRTISWTASVHEIKCATEAFRYEIDTEERAEVMGNGNGRGKLRDPFTDNIQIFFFAEGILTL